MAWHLTGAGIFAKRTITLLSASTTTTLASLLLAAPPPVADDKLDDDHVVKHDYHLADHHEHSPAAVVSTPPGYQVGNCSGREFNTNVFPSERLNPCSGVP